MRELPRIDAKPKPRPSRFLVLALLLALASRVLGGEGGKVSGWVRDSTGAAIAGAEVSLFTAQQSTIGTTRTDSEGRFGFSGIASGSYLLVISSRGFSQRRQAVAVDQRESATLDVVLDAGMIIEEVTVTASPGVVNSVESVAQRVNVIDDLQIEQRAKAVTAQVASEEVGVHLQRTSPTIAGVFVRGLTGNKVNVFVDGVRYSTSAMRGGISTFLDLIDPTTLQAVEILRGPNSAQYGSDALGGSLQFLTRRSVFAKDDSEVHGKLGVSFNSVDAGYGSNLTTSYATRRFALSTNLSGLRVNTLRTGGGVDSHSALTRFFALPSSLVVGDRMPDTAFTQYGGLIKMNWAPAAGSQFIVNYARSQQDGGKRFDQLLGGDGNLVADLRNLMLDLFYVRFDRVKLGCLDSLTATYSFNAQREERVNQGGNGNARGGINHEPERTGVHGVQAVANKLLGARNNLLLGGEYYHERIAAPSYGFNPVTGIASVRRGRVPDNARYESGGVYAQDMFEAVPKKLRLVGNLRYSGARYRARAEDSPLANGKPLWPDDSLHADDVTFRAGAVVMPVEGFSLMANFSRGFRAPHVTDLGTLGLTGSGFEVAAPDVAGLGAAIGSTAGSEAVSTGMPVVQVEPETSKNYEVGARYHARRIDTEFAFFVNDIDNNITKQALILPAGSVGLKLGDQTITSQSAAGVVFVSASTNPVLVRANFDDARLYGFEHTFDARLSPEWSFASVFTYIRALDKRTNLPPNIEGGTPAPDGYLKIRYAPAKSRFWVEPYVHAAARQDRLSSLDLEDRRTGATRSRSSIASFFTNGARFRGLVSAGPDGIAGNADDRLLVTGETVAQIQDRVLGRGVSSAPMFTAVPGYITFNVRGGVRLGERHDLMVDFENIGDRNYRGISWGLDAPGRGVFIRYNTRF